MIFKNLNRLPRFTFDLTVEMKFESTNSYTVNFDWNSGKGMCVCSTQEDPRGTQC